jgi:hypothetical protein
MPGNFEVEIAEDEAFQVIDSTWESNYKDLMTEWTEIRYQDRTYFINLYDLAMNAYEDRAKKAPEKAKQPDPAPIKIHMAPDEYSPNFPLNYSSRDEIASHQPYALGPGWSEVKLKDDDGSTFYAKTDDLTVFLSGGKVDKVDVPEKSEDDSADSSVEEEDVEIGLDPADYPAGQHDVTITKPITLPASTTQDGAYGTTVELFAGNKIPVTVDDALTKDFGRCKIVFFNHTYYVPLDMLITPTERKPEINKAEDVVEVDEENFVPEEEGVQLKAIEGVMDLDPDNEPEIIKRSEATFLPHSALKDIMEYEERGTWIALIYKGAFYYATISDWEAFKDA